MKSYRHIYERGKFKDLLFKAKNDDSDEGRFWMMVAFFNLGQPDLAKQVISSYDETFSTVDDVDIRQNFLNYANNLPTVNTPFPSEPPPTKSAIWSIANLDHRIKSMYHQLFTSVPSDDIARRFVTSKHVNYTDYICKFADSDEAIEKLKRQYNLLKALKDKLSVNVPDPISFEIEEGGEFAAFMYKKISGKHMFFEDKLHQQVLDLILELQSLHEHKAVKSHIIPFTPDFEELDELLTIDNMQQRYGSHFEDQDFKVIRSFVELCQNHLPTHPSRTFVHGDLYTGNIITNSDHTKITGLIDFERGWYADPWIDFSKLSYNDEFLETLLKLYDEQVKSIDTDHTMAKVLLYRGMFILRRMRTAKPNQLINKITSWIIKPYSKIRKLIV